jgi:hypothetical protein
VKKATRWLYFWHASKQTSSGFELSSGEISSCRAASPGFFEEVKSAIAELNGWPINDFSVVSLSFLGEYEHEAR